MRPQQWSQAQDGWLVAVDVGSDGSIGIEVWDGDLKGHLRLRNGERARVLEALLKRALKEARRNAGVERHATYRRRRTL